MKPLSACRHLQNKAYFCDAEPKEHVDDFATPFWCLESHDAVGPDGEAVDSECCGPDRPCFKPEVEL